MQTDFKQMLVDELQILQAEIFCFLRRISRPISKYLQH